MSNGNSLSARIEAVLFFRNEPADRKDLAKSLGISPEEVEQGLQTLAQDLAGRGIALIDDGKEVELRTAPAFAPLIEGLQKEALSRDLGKAGLETLAIVLYKGASTKAEIEFIRGVNSSYILRALSVRGLLRRVSNPKDERSFLYEPTAELLAHLGAGKREDLPEWETLQETLSDILVRKEAAAAETDEPSNVT